MPKLSAACAALAIALVGAGRAPADEPLCSPGVCALISLAATTAGVVPGVVLLEDRSHVTAGLIVTGASIVLLPSVGRMIGGDGNGAATWIGARAVVAFVAGILVGLAVHANEGGGWILALGAVLPGGALPILALADIGATAPDLRNQRVAVVPARIGDRGALGLALGGSF